MLEKSRWKGKWGWRPHRTLSGNLEKKSHFSAVTEWPFAFKNGVSKWSIHSNYFLCFYFWKEKIVRLMNFDWYGYGGCIMWYRQGNKVRRIWVFANLFVVRWLSHPSLCHCVVKVTLPVPHQIIPLRLTKAAKSDFALGKEQQIIRNLFIFFLFLFLRFFFDSILSIQKWNGIILYFVIFVCYWREIHKEAR